MSHLHKILIKSTLQRMVIFQFWATVFILSDAHQIKLTFILIFPYKTMVKFIYIIILSTYVLIIFFTESFEVN